MDRIYHRVSRGSSQVPEGTIVYQLDKTGTTVYDLKTGAKLSDRHGNMTNGEGCGYAFFLDPIYKGKEVELLCGYSNDSTIVVRRECGQYKVYEAKQKGNSVNSADAVAKNKAKLKRKTYLIKKGYHTSRYAAEKAEGKVENCSLLRKWNELKDKVEYPLIGSPKVDGIRATVYGDPQLVSRGGKEIYAPHLLTQLGNAGGPDDLMEVDGELYIPGYPLEKIQSIVTKKYHSKKTLLHFFIFDIPLPVPFFHRLTELRKLGELKDCPNIHVLPQVVINNEQEADDYYKKMLALGYEGVVYRTLKGTYVGGRTPEILKRKPLLTGEFKIADIVRDKNDRVIFVLEMPNGDTFRSVPTWPHEKREKDYGWATKGHYVAEVTYYDKTDKGIPKFSNVKVLRQVDNDGNLNF